MLADNVVALVVEPERAANDPGTALSPLFSYDSRDTGSTPTLNQLPPRLRVVLVAIDSVSADHLAAVNGSAAPPLVSPAYFQQAAQLDQDLAALDGDLTSHKILHRIFDRQITLNTAVWSNTAAE